MEAAALGPDGVVVGLQPGAVYIDHTTTDPKLVEAVGAAAAARGAALIDAPVMGDRQGIQKGAAVLLPWQCRCRTTVRDADGCRGI
eukprot:SAG22_NODE_8769_length_631_cov_1.046992_1_plen_86_part_00